MEHASPFRSTQFTLAGAAALALACSGEAGFEEPIDTVQEHVNYRPVSTSTTGLNTYGYKWDSALGPIKMTPTASSACFLATVGGTFQSDSDRVEIIRGIESHVEYWYLTGNAGPAGARAASAFCTLNTTVIAGSEKSVQAGQIVDLVNPDTGRVCLLTGIWGNIGEFSSTAEGVYISKLPPKWVLNGFSAGGAAKCIQKAIGPSINLSPAGSPAPFPIPNSTNNASDGPTMCALFAVTGKFRGGAIQVYSRNLGGNQWDWAMRTTANPTGGGTPSGSGGCFL